MRISSAVRPYNSYTNRSISASHADDPTGRGLGTNFDPNGNPVTQDTAYFDGTNWIIVCPTHCGEERNKDNVKVATSNHDGTATSKLDGNNNVTSVSLSCGCGGMPQGTYEYDKMNRMTTATNALSQKSTLVYDLAGNKTSVMDSLSHETTYKYDAQNRLKSMTDAEDRSTLFAYHLDGQLKSVADPENNVTSYKYDEARRLIEITDPNGKTTTNKYDDADRLTDVYDRNGRQIHFTWDAADRLIGEEWYDSKSSPVNTVSYEYDKDDRMTLASDYFATNSMDFWSDGQLKSATNEGTPDMPEISLTYDYEDINGLPFVSTITDSLGGTTDYVFSETGRLKFAALNLDGKVSDASAELEYTPEGWLELIKFRSGTADGWITSDYTPNEIGQVTDIVNEYHIGLSTTTLLTFEYDYEGGRIKSYTGPEGTRNYKHDDTNQIKEVNDGTTVLESFAYDDNGNRDMSGYDTDTGNRLMSDGTFDYEYDLESNMVSKVNISSGEETTFAWDHRNRLTDLEVRTSKGALLFEERYIYDVLNRRIGVWTDADGDGKGAGQQMWSAYDGANVWADFDNTEEMVTQYLNGRQMDQRFARYDVKNEETAFYLTDNISSVRQIVEIDGSIIYSANYTAFGMIASLSGTGGDRFKYTGRELDASGLYYYRARYYGAGIGRYVSEDPIGFAGNDANLYRYVGNEVVNHADPTGHFGVIGGIVGGGGGFVAGGIVGWWSGDGFWNGAIGGAVGGGLTGAGVPPWIGAGIGAGITGWLKGEKPRKLIVKVCIAAAGGKLLGPIAEKAHDGLGGGWIAEIIVGAGIGGWAGMPGIIIDATDAIIEWGKNLGGIRDKQIDDLIKGAGNAK